MKKQKQIYKVLTTIKNIMKRKKHLLVLLSTFITIYFFIRLLTFYANSLSVIEFAFLTMIFGLAPAYFFRSVFKFENIIDWLVTSSALGMLFIPFLFLLFGWLGWNFVFVYSVVFLYICSFLGIILLFVFADEETVIGYINLNGVTKIDVFFYIILFSYTLILSLHNFDRVYPRWDAFTLWGLDAKLIFDFNRLRDSTFDVFGHFTNTSYYPIYYSIVYDIYGAIVEQFASWINVFINFLALLLVYSSVRQKRFLHKLFIVTVLIMISHVADQTVFMFSMYTDTLVAFLLLLFILILINNYEYTLDTYSRRMFLLLLLPVSFFFVKTGLLFVTYILLIAYITYDFKFLLNYKKVLIKRVDFWVVILAVVAIFQARSFYVSYTLHLQSIPSVSQLVPTQSVMDPTISSFYIYTKELFFWMIEKTPYLVGLWFLGILSVLKIKSIDDKKKFLYIYFLAAGLFFSFCMGYIIKQRSLLSGSLIRYTAITMYLSPLIFTYISIKISKKKAFISTIVLSIGLGYFVFRALIPIPFFQAFTLSTGSYKVYLQQSSDFAKNVLSITGDDAKILIANDSLIDGNKQIGNMDLNTIYLRYFLMYNSVGGQYKRNNLDTFSNIMSQEKPNYILLLSYSGVFDDCENIFNNEHSYLIKLNGDEQDYEDGCVFSQSVIYDVTK